MSECNCFEKTLDKVKEHIKKAIPEGAIEIKIDWQGRAFFLRQGDKSPVNPKVKYEYRQAKKGGGYRANLNKDTVSIMATHCMFCGREYEQKGE